MLSYNTKVRHWVGAPSISPLMMVSKLWPMQNTMCSNGNGLLFRMTQPTSRSTIKAIACSKLTISEHKTKWNHNGTIADQCKQRGALCHIGLAKDHGGHLVNQPRLSHFDKCWETTVGHQISIMKRKTKTKNEWTQNMVKKMYRWNRTLMYTD